MVHRRWVLGVLLALPAWVACGEVVGENPLLRALEAEKPDPKAVRAELVNMLDQLERGDTRLLLERVERTHGTSLAAPLAGVAVDATVQEAVRARAAERLGYAVYHATKEAQPRLRALALPLLQKLVSDPSPLMRRHAVQGLCTADRTQPHLEHFEALLADPDRQVRLFTAYYLTCFTDHRETWPYVKRALRDSDRGVRRAITEAHALKWPRTKDHRELLFECCASAGEEETLELLESAARVVSDADLPTLAKLFEAGTPRTRAQIVRLAGRTRQPHDLLKRALESDDADVRAAGLDVVERGGDDAALELLRRFIAARAGEERQRAETILAALTAPTPLPDVRKLMAEVLPPKAPPRAARELIAEATRTYEPPPETLGWLFLADDPRDVELFRPLLESNNPKLRAVACKYLGRVKDGPSFEKVVSLAQDRDTVVRRLAAEALGDYGRIEGLPHLLRLRQDTDPDVRDRIPTALGKIPGAEATQGLIEFVQTDGKGMTWSIQHRALDALVARRDRAAIPVLIELLDPPKGFSATPSVQLALKELSGHWIKGNYEDPADRKRLVIAWREWWGKAAATLEPPRREPEATYCGCRLMIEPPTQRPWSDALSVYFQLHGGTPVAPLVVPVDDGGVDGYLQYVLHRDGREVERGNLPENPAALGLHRYSSIPFGNIASVGGMRATSVAFSPRAAAGDYELQVEARFLCTTQASKDFVENVFASGPHRTAAEAFTLKSNRVRLTLPATKGAREQLTEEGLDQLARLLAQPKWSMQTLTVVGSAGGPEAKPQPRTITLDGPWAVGQLARREGSRALPVVLKHYDPKTANDWQLYYLAGVDDPRARDALDRAFLADNPLLGQRMGLLGAIPDRRAKERLVGVATAEIGSEGWNWHTSREALEALDGRLGPDDKAFVPDLCRELAGRLISARDRHVMRGGESLWGAFRTAFFLGQIGDRRAMGLLRQATKAGVPRSYLGKEQCVFLRWYAAAALKLIEVQNRPEAERRTLAKEWLTHCFSSAEEHFMSRSRLIPVLSQMLGEERKAFYEGLLRGLTDPWMAHDARRLGGSY
ncbi:MAG: hypothetical protein FJ290_09985 [Planctomycetes bacterium]|nr:hypothetical protein [Planctomycetota bacterium]